MQINLLMNFYIIYSGYITSHIKVIEIQRHVEKYNRVK